jgi:hypothetical protein
VGDREIPETYLNALSRNTSETDISPHGTKSLLTIVLGGSSGWISTQQVNCQPNILHSSNTLEEM